MPELFVGIDVAKDTSSAQGIDSNDKGRFSLTFAMDSEGFVQLWKAITAHSKDLLVHRDTISQLSLSQDLQDFRDIARERESVGNMIAAHKVEIKRLLQSTFPELEHIGDLSTRVMLEFIAAFPSARLVKMAKPKAIQKILQRKGVGTRLTYTAEDLIQAAKQSVATISPARSSAPLAA